jgi:hypothetical protein
VFVDHFWAGEAHDYPDFFAVFWFVAVYAALGAGIFILSEGALIEALHGVA